MLILSFESSCDETSVAVVRDGREVLSNIVRTQTEHAEFGGVVPELASRAHIEAITVLAQKAISEAGITISDIDAVASTTAPGLIGAVLVGLSFAKATAFALNVPFVPVHHVRGHIAANYIAFPELKPPFFSLMTSGGNTLFVDVADYTVFNVLGGTRDDAAGETFDKVARVLGLGYPGGAPLDRLATTGDDHAYKLPQVSVSTGDLDVSFSGLKTAVVNLVHNAEQKGEQLDLPGLAASFEAAVSDMLVPRAVEAAKRSCRKTMVVAGGVAANSRIRADLFRACENEGIELLLLPLSLCGDNAAMIGAQGYYEFLAGNIGDLTQNGYPTMDISQSF